MFDLIKRWKWYKILIYKIKFIRIERGKMLDHDFFFLFVYAYNFAVITLIYGKNVFNPIKIE